MPTRKTAPRESGFTLVEVMVSVGIFGLCTIALATLMASHQKLSAKATSEAELGERQAIFRDTLDARLQAATQIISCGCPGGCVFPDPQATPIPADFPLQGTAFPADCGPRGPNGQAGCPQPLIRFESEDTINPGSPADPGCIGASVAQAARPATPDGMILRGCKRRFRIEYEPPQTSSANNPARDGVLRIVEEGTFNANPTGILPANQRGRMSEFHGVYALVCGHPTYTFVNPATGVAQQRVNRSRFMIFAKSKARHSVATFGTQAYESSHPNELNQGFRNGTHRILSLDTTFTNLSRPGIIVGSAFTFRECTRSGFTDPQGNCCSGFSNAARLCLNEWECVGPGGAAGVQAQCCSHQMHPTQAGICF